MTSLWDTVAVVATVGAALSSLALAAVALARRASGRLRWAFVLGMLAFAVESLVNYTLLTATVLPGDRESWLEIAGMLALTAPLVWAFFVEALLHPPGMPRSRLLITTLAAVTALSLGAGSALMIWPGFEVADVVAPFSAARLRPAALFGVVVQVLTTVGIVGGLETFLRTASRSNVWRSKYLVLGLGAIFLGRFYFLSQVLLFHVVMATYLVSGAAMLLIGNLAIAASLLRERLRKTELTVSRVTVYQSVGVGVLGLYLLTVGVLGWLLAKLDIPEAVFWSSLLVFVSAVALAAFLMSEDVRWRAKRVIGRHLYRSKYDYREQWMAVTKQLGSVLSIEELVANVLGAVTNAVGAAKAALYLDDGDSGSCALAGELELSLPLPVLDASLPLLQQLARERRPILVEAEEILGFMPSGSVAVPLAWQGRLTGVMLVGPERMRTPYGVEDLQFLATLGEQAAGAIVTARLSETLARAREFEAFHRLTSFVIHDLKNSIASLSLLSDNALEHFDDPEFQRDAVTTLSRTVGRMKGLLTRLSGPPQSASLHFRSLDLAALAQEAARTAGSVAVSVVRDVAGVLIVHGDVDALLRVFQNLVKNAVEALPGREGVVTVRTYAEGRWAVFAVQDSGCGMSEEFVRTSLFAPFRSTKPGGWGIGLYQSKTIVEAHGGRIEVATKEGAGTTFLVRLPMAREPA